MAKRYSGSLQISVVYDDKNHYRTAVSRGGKLLWRGIVKPAPAGFGPGVAYDSPKAYDEIASSALAFADDEERGIADEAEFDENLTGYLIRRAPRTTRARSAAGHATRRASHATMKSPAQLDREIAEFIAKPKLGDPKWEREWGDLLAEKHTKARLPTIDELARALTYIEREYVLREGRADMEQLAEGLAFGQRSSIDSEDKRRAKEMFEQVSSGTWLRVAERANYLSREQNEAPRYLKK